jgi:hypothetical protein
MKKADHQRLRDALRPLFDGRRNEIAHSLDASTYRAFPGFSPSDVKLGDPDIRKKTGRGAVIQMAYKLGADQLKRAGEPVPPGWDFEESESDVLDFGDIYHSLVLEPEEARKRYVVVDDSVRDSLLADVRERKRAEVMAKTYSGNCAEAKAWKSIHGRSPSTESEKAEVLAAYHARLLRESVDEIEWHGRRPEFIEWRNEQEKAGKTVVWPDVWASVNAMVESIWELPENAAVAEYLQGHLMPYRAEVSMFSTAFEMPDGSKAQLKGRADWVPANGIVDLKSTRGIDFDSRGESDFGRDVVAMGYDVSMGAYLYQLQRLGMPNCTRAFFLAQEKRIPYRVRLFEVPHSVLAYGAVRYLSKIRDLWEGLRDGNLDRDAMGQPFTAPIALDLPEWYCSLADANPHRSIIREIHPFDAA